MSNKRKVQDELAEKNAKKRPVQEEDNDSDDEDLELLDEDGVLDEEGLSGEEFDEEGDSDDDEEDEEDDSDQEFINQEINVDFVAYGTDETDFNGIKCLLQRLWLKENIDISGLANLLIEENTIASVLKQDDEEKSEKDKKSDEKVEEDEGDDEDVYGVVSLIPFNDHFTTKDCIKQIKALLLSRIPKGNPVHEKLNDSKSVCALVINERFLNLPPKLSLPCYQQLIADLKQYKPKSKDNKLYHFDNVIMVCKVHKEKGKSKDSQTIYVNPEDEVFDQLADASFEYSVADQCDSDVLADWEDDENMYEPFRKVLLLSKNKWIKTIDETLKEVL